MSSCAEAVTRQREVLQKTGHLGDVIAALARATVGQDDGPQT
jgi:hypothetical protein